MTTNKKIVLKISNLDKFLDKKQILFGVNLEIYDDEVFGFLGPNGAGKTTTMKCILNLINQEVGEIKVLDGYVKDKEIRKQIGFMPENTYLYRHLTGKEFLRFNGKFFDIPNLEEKVNYLMEKVGLSKAGDKLLSKYSKGMLQRVGLAQAIINDPKIVFLDEPMSGLDPLGRKMVKDLVLELKKNGTTVFFNTHILSDVQDICDRFAIIHQGKIIAQEKTSSIKGSLEDYFIEKIEKENEREKGN
ncbi:MAG: ABC transporter ATP-binding protein [Candidatus Gracilibacteria bacterium]|nr:ABC transporter ATP-binding protein [Candidatus Gracilibacteria bacterium]MDD3119890.1 ABC transporter ATP-binding protein [Candidatus Gracilibacteria bacterium]MDD4530061.1 ABC transporter ATP-binding protein [Candidatus Gracilibacteria bacterium]